MRTGDEYRASLRDGRAVWLEGRRVDDVAGDPLLGKSVDWVATTYDRYAGETNAMFRIPTTQAVRPPQQVPHTITHPMNHSLSQTN